VTSSDVSREDWNKVTLAHGKGRFVREKEKQKLEQGALETAMELE
jgi:hypothetical protein